MLLDKFIFMFIASKHSLVSLDVCSDRMRILHAKVDLNVYITLGLMNKNVVVDGLLWNLKPTKQLMLHVHNLEVVSRYAIIFAIYFGFKEQIEPSSTQIRKKVCRMLECW